MKKIKNITNWVATFAVMLIICIPGLWVVLSAFRPNREILAKPAIWIPEHLSFDNFIAIFGGGKALIAIPVPAYFINSLVIAFTSTFVAIIIGMSGGYAFARFRFRFKDSIFLG
ncbi:MAG: carbohydrate ABC transporter permease, partial [Rhizobiales bacterium]|nr:carbohydrate ABC transporter permease [Hyphomicrobiales bacterium]